MRFSFASPVIDREFRYNTIKVAVDPRGDSRIEALKTEVNLIIIIIILLLL